MLTLNTKGSWQSSFEGVLFVLDLIPTVTVTFWFLHGQRLLDSYMDSKIWIPTWTATVGFCIHWHSNIWIPTWTATSHSYVDSNIWIHVQQSLIPSNIWFWHGQHNLFPTWTIFNTYLCKLVKGILVEKKPKTIWDQYDSIKGAAAHFTNLGFHPTKDGFNPSYVFRYKT